MHLVVLCSWCVFVVSNFSSFLRLLLLLLRLLLLLAILRAVHLWVVQRAACVIQMNVWMRVIIQSTCYTVDAYIIIYVIERQLLQATLIQWCHLRVYSEYAQQHTHTRTHTHSFALNTPSSGWTSWPSVVGNDARHDGTKEFRFFPLVLFLLHLVSGLLTERDTHGDREHLVFFFFLVWHRLVCIRVIACTRAVSHMNETRRVCTLLRLFWPVLCPHTVATAATAKPAS